MCECLVFMHWQCVYFFHMNMPEDLLFPIITLPAVAIPSHFSWCSLFPLFRLPALCHTELIRRCPLTPRDVHHPPLLASWPLSELASQLRGGRWDREKPNVKVAANKKRRVLAYFKMIFLPSWSYFLMSWLSLYMVVLFCKGHLFS